MGYTLVTPPASYPVTLAEAKANCRVDGPDEDTFLNGLIAAATAHIEERTGRSIVERVYDVTFDAFADEMLIPVGPVLSCWCRYLDTSDVTQTLSGTVYQVDLTREPHRIYRAPDASWPGTSDRKNAVTVTVTVGYDAVPAALKQAILLLIGTWYSNRENEVIGQTVAELPIAVSELLANHTYNGF